MSRHGRHGACEVRLPLARPALSGSASLHAGERGRDRRAGRRNVRDDGLRDGRPGFTGDVCAAARATALRLLSPDGTVTALAPSGLALGIEADQHYEQDSANLPPGAALCLYTDGLIEVRRDGVQYGVERLDAASSRVASSPPRNLRSTSSPTRADSPASPGTTTPRRHPPRRSGSFCSQPREPGLRRGGAHASLNVLVFFAGAGALATEIAAASGCSRPTTARRSSGRTSSVLVLASLSVGYWLGGKAADRNPSPRVLGRIVVAAGVLIAIVPFAAGPFLDVSVRARPGLRRAAIGSFFAVLALFAPPVILLGMVAPFAVRLGIEDVRDAGSVACGCTRSTAGSLLDVPLRARADSGDRDPAHTAGRGGHGGALRAVLLGRRWLVVAAALGALIAIPPGEVRAEPGSSTSRSPATSSSTSPRWTECAAST